MLEKNKNRKLENFGVLSNLIADPVWVVDEEGICLAVNQAMSQVLGYDEQELVGKNAMNLGFLDQENKGILLENFEKRMNGLDAACYEIEATAKNGEIKFFEVKGKKIWYANKNVDLVVLHDISEQKKKSEERIRLSEEKYKNLFENAPDVIVTFDLAGKILSVNKAIVKFGFKEKEIVGNSVFKLVPEEYTEKMLMGLKKIAAGKPTHNEIDMVTPIGKRSVEYNSNPIWLNGKVVGYQTIIRDVTERKKAEEALRESEKKLLAASLYARSLIEASVDPIVTISVDGKITDVNKSTEVATGLPRDKLIGSDFSDYFADPEEARSGYQKVFTEGLVKDYPLAIRHKSGKIIDVLYNATVYRNEMGGVQGVFAAARDITKRKQAEQKLQEAEKRYRALFNQAPLGVLVIDPQAKKPVEFNEVAHTQLGYSREEFSKLCIPDFEAKETFDEISKHVATMVKEGGGEFETKHSTKNGEIRDVLVNTRTVELAGKKFLYCVFHDITESRKVQKALMESEAGYRQLVELAQEGIWAVDNDFNTVFVNPHMAQMLGYTESEMIGKSIFDFLIKTDLEKTAKYLLQFKQGMKGNFEHEFMCKDGSLVNTSIALAQIKDDEGSCLGTLALVSDITLRKKMESELRQETEKLETITESIGVGLTITSKDYRILWTNKVMKQLRGIPDLEGRRCYATYNYLDTVCPECGVKKVFEGKESDSREFMVFDREKGVTVWTQLIATPIKDKDGNITAALELVIPITERKQQEREIENLAKFPSENPNPIFRIDEKGTILYCNQAGDSLLTAWKSMVGERAPEHIIRDAINALALDRRVEVEETFGAKSCEAKIFSLLFAPVTAAGYVNIYATDITERKRTENFLRSSEEKFRNLAEQSPNIIFINQKGKVVYANTEAEKATGYTKEEFYSPKFNFMNLIAPESKESVKSIFIKHLKGEEVPPYEYRLISKKGKTKDVINSTKVIDYNGEPAILGIETDITESKKLKEKLEQYSTHLERLVKERTEQLEHAQAQLVKSERLAAIGELAGMVGHDLRNPLTGIKNAAYYLKKKGATCPEGQAKEMLEIIDKAIAHSNKIINDLLDYSRQMQLELTETETSALLNEAIQMIQVPDRIQIVNHVLEETWVRVDADKMMRVFINLIKNAIDAMPEKGTLEIRSCQIGENVEIAFADTGIGIPDEVLPKIFAPLVTTKAQGMGFGLAICKRIVDSHGGKIAVKTEVNKGTTFTIILPIKSKSEVGGEQTWINMPESLLSTTTKA